MKVFLAVPYSQLCDKNYNVKKEYRIFFEKLINNLKDIGCEYFLACEREQWGKKYTSDIESTLIDFDTIKNVDLICTIPGVPASGGVHVELGWASANKKKIKVFLNSNASYSPMITGLHSITDVDYYYYKEEFSDELLELIINEIKDFKRKELSHGNS